MSNLPPRRPGRPAPEDDYRDPSRRPSKSNTTTIVAVVVGVAVLLVCGCGGLLVVPALIGVGLPAVGGAREAAQRSQSKNNLKMVGIASHNFHDVHSHLPPFGPGERPGAEPPVSFSTSLLPYLEQQAAFNAIDFSKPWDDPANRMVFSMGIGALQRPNVNEPVGPDGYGLTHYVENKNVVGPDGRGLGFRDVTDGTSNTLLGGEIDAAYPAWGKPGMGRDPAQGFRGGPNGYGGGWGTPGAQMLLMDGSVRFVNADVDPAVAAALATPGGGEVVGEY